MEIWTLIIAVFGGGAVGAAVITFINNVVMHKMNEKTQAKIRAEEKEEYNLKDHDDRIQELERRSAADFKHLKLLDAQIVANGLQMQAVLKALHAQLSHSVTGNATGELKTALDNLVNFIIDN